MIADPKDITEDCQAPYASFDCHFKDRLNRMVEAVGGSNDSDLARALEIERQGLYAAKKKQQIPAIWVIKLSEQFGISADWILFGEGPMRREGARVGIDAEILTLVIEHVQRWLDENERELEPAKKAEVIVFLYEQCMQKGEADKLAVDKLLRLVV